MKMIIVIDVEKILADTKLGDPFITQHDASRLLDRVTFSTQQQFFWTSSTEIG